VAAVSNARERLVLHVTDPSTRQTQTWACPRDLRFTATAPGGFDTLSATLTWPDVGSAPSAVLRASAEVRVMDRATGDIAWEGTLDDPGGQYAPTALAYRASATGHRTILERRVESYAVRDTDLGNWTSTNSWGPSQPAMGDGGGFAAHSLDIIGSDAPTGYVQFTYPDGAKVATGTIQAVRYRPLLSSAGVGGSDQRIVWIMYSHDSQITSGPGDLRIELQVIGPTGTTQTVRSTAWSTTQVDESDAQGAGSWTITDAKSAILRSAYTGATVTRTSDLWTRIAGIVVVHQMVDKRGNLLSPNSSFSSAHAGGLIHDMIGRHLLGLVEVAAGLEFPATPVVDHAAWWGGASARDIADFVQSIQPDYWWGLWESSPVTGLPRIQYASWRDTAAAVSTLDVWRYWLQSPRDRVEFAGGLDDVYNQALVIYERSDGVPASLVVTGSVPELSRLGETRRTTVDLTGRGPLSATAATNVGLGELSKANLQRSSGVAYVTQPLIDHATGRQVEPWEIRPGYPVKTSVPTSAPTPSGTAIGVPDGESQFRLTSVTFDASAGAAELALDGGARSLFRRKKAPTRVNVPSGRLGDKAVGQTVRARKT
jgi:hypothetical protein